ncbi:MAG: PAS domain-containing protein [Deltaproteobacteria bacterium]|nr:PAS domain-containing protein [Deltaproteobacteria bacterium]MBI3293884.1 PAS domain-containing protein [Deltaproteobacteria bacterium]
MSSTEPQFPRRIFFRFVVLQNSLLLIAVAIAFFVVRNRFDHAFGQFLMVVCGAFALLSTWLSYTLVFPIGRLHSKTKAMTQATPESFSMEEVTRDSFGEWTEIEANLNQIRDDLEKKRRRLDRDRVELATVIGSLSDAILAVDPKGAPLFFNSRFALLYGGSTQSETWTLWDLIRETQILDAFSTALKEAQASATRTIVLDSESAGKRYLALSVSPLKRVDGSVYGAAGIFHDITELKLAEQMRIDFVANVSHELRTPLTSIKGYADTLEHDIRSGKPIDHEFMGVISKNTNRLMNLISDLLDLSSIESQSQSLHLEQLPTEEVTKRVVGQLRERFSSKNQTVETHFHSHQVYADPGRLEQILVNLLDNGYKYTPSGGKLSVEWLADGRDTILKVSDTGPGIPLEHRSRLFERFYRVDKARSREMGGTGLGLAIVKHIMQRHEGAVTVESAAGQGSTFICRFPNPDQRR